MSGRLLITGSRNWVDRDLMTEALRHAWQDLRHQGHDEIVLVHGAARGADQLAAAIWREVGLSTEAHPADWNAHGKKAGPIRNLHMVQLGADLCLAFPLGESRGTRHCMEAAAKAGIPVSYVESQ